MKKNSYIIYSLVFTKFWPVGLRRVADSTWRDRPARSLRGWQRARNKCTCRWRTARPSSRRPLPKQQLAAAQRGPLPTRLWTADSRRRLMAIPCGGSRNLCCRLSKSIRKNSVSLLDYLQSLPNIEFDKLVFNLSNVKHMCSTTHLEYRIFSELRNKSLNKFK